MNKLLVNPQQEELTASKAQLRKQFLTELAKDMTREGTLEALFNKTKELRLMHHRLHISWDYGQFDLIRAVCYTLHKSSLTKSQRNNLTEVLAYWERFFMRMNAHTKLLEDLCYHYKKQEAELRELLGDAEEEEKG